MPTFQSGQRVHLVDKKGRQYAFTLKAGDRFQYSGETIPHDDLIGQPDGTMVRLSGGKTMMALMPTLAEYTLKMPSRRASPLPQGHRHDPHVGRRVPGCLRV